MIYRNWLRIEEVLELTLEDLVIYPDDKNSYIAYIRNRLFDKEYQNAKICLKVKNKNDNTSTLYNEEDIGYQTVIVTKKLKDDIEEYIKLLTNIMKVSNTVLDNIINFATSDCVTKTRKENRYIFLNKNGTPLNTSI